MVLHDYDLRWRYQFDVHVVDVRKHYLEFLTEPQSSIHRLIEKSMLEGESTLGDNTQKE